MMFSFAVVISLVVPKFRLMVLCFLYIFKSIYDARIYLQPLKYLQAFVSLCFYKTSIRVKVITLFLILILILIPILNITLRPRIANRVGEDSYCRGGIVNTRRGRSRALFVRPEIPKALWRFRASTSNSLRGLMWPHTHTQVRIRDIDHIYAQQDIRVCGDDHFEPPLRQFSNPKALCLLRVSI